jgi:hypothetical protein
MPEGRGAALCLCVETGLLIALAAQLLDAQEVFVDGDAEDDLCTVLVDDEAVEVVAQTLGGDVGVWDVGGGAEGPTCGLVGVVEGGEAVAGEV